MAVKVTEENNEAERIGQHDSVHGVGEVAVDKQVVGGVRGDDEKLQLIRETRRWQMTKICIQETSSTQNIFILNLVEKS